MKEQIVDTLRDRVSEIITLYEKEKSEKRELIEKNNELVKQLKNLEREIQIQEEKYNNLKIAKQLIVLEKGKSEDAKNEINNIVREIDNCIAFLNQ